MSGFEDEEGLGATAAVTVRVSLEIVIAVDTGCQGLWLVARSRVAKENNDKETQFFRLQQGTPCSKDIWMLATCRPVEIMRWDLGDDRRAELLECCGGLTPWQATKWVGALDDTDTCDKDVVIRDCWE